MNTNKKTPHITTKDKLILYDGVCKLCNAWIRLVIRHDKKNMIKLVAMQTKKGQDILRSLGKPTANFETMLFISNNKTYGKSRAFFKIIQYLPFPVKALIIFQYIPNVISDLIYDQIAKNRYKLFGKYENCALKKHEKKSRCL